MSTWYPAFEGKASHAFWLDEPLVTGSTEDLPKDAGIVVIGSGLSGASSAYWLTERGFDNITLIDYRPGDAATNRNCGHILYGTVESAHALTAIKGEKLARSVIELSVDLCHDVRDTIAKLDIDCDYKQDGYLVMAIDDVEMKEIEHSVELLNKFGLKNEVRSKKDLESLGYRNVYGGRFEQGDASAHPVKFRNALMKEIHRRGVNYYSQVRALAVNDQAGTAVVDYDRGPGTERRVIKADAVVIAANAYSPLFSDFFSSRRLVEPFRGQIVASAPLKHQFKFKGPQSFDHGYEYALVTPDNRLVIGGWRNHTAAGEVGTYDITVNKDVEKGLKDFVGQHYDLGGEKPQWTHSWSGIMAASATGLPFIGPTSSPIIFSVTGYTGHGFSWAHGSARILADIMSGETKDDPELLALFKP